MTCPRCGWPSTHLIKPYHESAWSEHGGMCGRCCQQAASHYDAQEKWPAFAEPGVYGTMTRPGQMPASSEDEW